MKRLLPRSATPNFAISQIIVATVAESAPPLSETT